MTTTSCNIYMCIPSGGADTKMPLDGATQMPVTVYYAVWTQAGSEMVRVDDDDVTISLVAFQDYTWYDGTTYTEATDLNDAGWKYSTTQGPDALADAGGCAGIPPSGNDVDYTPVTFYLSHDYASPQDIKNYISANQADKLTSATFEIAAMLSYKGNTWYTSKKKNNVTNKIVTNETVTVTLCDGTPSLTPYLGNVTGNDTIYANENTYIPLYCGFQIVTLTSQGGSGLPLSTQVKGKCSLVSAADGSDFNGSGAGGNMGVWLVDKSGTDSSTSSGKVTSCVSCGNHVLPPKNSVHTVFWVSHGKSYIRSQSTAVSMKVTYTPNGASNPFVWSTDYINASPSSCCYTLYALGAE